MKGQRFANAFPLWSKIRNDVSSTGQRFMAPFGDVLDTEYAALVKDRESKNCLARDLGFGTVSVIQLEEDQFIVSETNEVGVVTYQYPVIVGDGIELTFDTDIEDFLYGVPTRLVLLETIAETNNLVYDSAIMDEPDPLPFPGFLSVAVLDSTLYEIRNRTTRMPANHWFVQLTGRDVNQIPLTETIQIPDDGVWASRHIWSEVDEVHSEGFDGEIIVEVGETMLPIADPFRVGTTADFEGPLLLDLDVDGESYLIYSVAKLKRGFEYRDGTDEELDNVEELARVVLRDMAGETVNCTDITIDPTTTFLYGCGDQKVYIWDHTLPDLSPPEALETESNYISLLPLRGYATFGLTEYLWTWFRQPRFNVVSVQIRRVSPSGVVRYLDAGHNWVAPETSISGTPGTLPEETWSDFRFETDYDETGTWWYYCTVTSQQDVTVTTTGVHCGELVAVAEFELEVAAESLFFGYDGNLWVIGDATYRYQTVRDTYTAEPSAQQILLRERYTEIEVT